jgi:hypothetical protein
MSDTDPWLVRRQSTVPPKERTRIDRQAERIVTTAFIDACKDRERSPRAFDAAVEAYCGRYAHVPRHVARYAVADILSRHTIREPTVGGERHRS